LPLLTAEDLDIDQLQFVAVIFTHPHAS